MIPLKRNLPIVFLGVVFALFPGCSKKSPSPDVVATQPETKSNVKDLGEMLFVLNEPTVEDLDIGGKTIVFMPTMLPDGALQITASVEQRSTTGQKSSVALPTISTLPNQPVEISVDKMRLRFIPKLKGK